MSHRSVTPVSQATSQSSPSGAPPRGDQGAPPATEVRVAHRLHAGWWVATALVVVLAAALLRSLLTNPNLQLDVVGEYFFSAEILRGLARTLQLTAISMVAGIVIGVLTAVMRLSPVKLLSGIAGAYVWFFRGTPLLVQIIFWYNLSALFPELTVGIPFGGPTFHSWDTNVVVTPLMASLLALALNEGAYMAEIVRGGILSVDQGQQEAARALGMRGRRVMRRIILPQAMRVVVPPTGNQVISMLKSSALVSVTSMPELLYSAQLIYQRTFETIPLLIVASLWYLIVTTVLSIAQFYVERRFARGSRNTLPSTPWQRLRALRMRGAAA